MYGILIALQMVRVAINWPWFTSMMWRAVASFARPAQAMTHTAQFFLASHYSHKRVHVYQPLESVQTYHRVVIPLRNMFLFLWHGKGLSTVAVCSCNGCWAIKITMQPCHNSCLQVKLHHICSVFPQAVCHIFVLTCAATGGVTRPGVANRPATKVRKLFEG